MTRSRRMACSRGLWCVSSPVDTSVSRGCAESARGSSTPGTTSAAAGSARKRSAPLTLSRSQTAREEAVALSPLVPCPDGARGGGVLAGRIEVDALPVRVPGGQRGHVQDERPALAGTLRHADRLPGDRAGFARLVGHLA